MSDIHEMQVYSASNCTTCGKIPKVNTIIDPLEEASEATVLPLYVYYIYCKCGKRTGYHKQLRDAAKEWNQINTEIE